MSWREHQAERARDLKAACRPARERLVSLFCSVTSEEQQAALDAINRVYGPIGKQLVWKRKEAQAMTDINASQEGKR